MEIWFLLSWWCVLHISREIAKVMCFKQTVITVKGSHGIRRPWWMSFLKSRFFSLLLLGWIASSQFRFDWISTLIWRHEDEFVIVQNSSGNRRGKVTDVLKQLIHIRLRLERKLSSTYRMFHIVSSDDWRTKFSIFYFFFTWLVRRTLASWLANWVNEEVITCVMDGFSTCNRFKPFSCFLSDSVGYNQVEIFTCCQSFFLINHVFNSTYSKEASNLEIFFTISF